MSDLRELSRSEQVARAAIGRAQRSSQRQVRALREMPTWQAVAVMLLVAGAFLAVQAGIVAVLMPPPAPPDAAPGSDVMMGSNLRWLAFIVAFAAVPLGAVAFTFRGVHALVNVLIASVLAGSGMLGMASAIEGGALTVLPDHAATTPAPSSAPR